MTTPALFPYLLRLADDRLVLGHRLSEWCGHGPILEEDIALANIALDLIGEATLALQARRRDRRRRAQRGRARLLPRRRRLSATRCSSSCRTGDFAFTIVRQFFFSVYSLLQMEALQKSANAELAGIAAKAVKEARYHVRHSAQWVVTLGDGTDESHARAQRALDELWRYTGELFIADDVDREVAAAGIGVDPSALADAWRTQVDDVLQRATLTAPTVDVHAARRPRRKAHRAPRPHAVRDADRRAFASGRVVVKARLDTDDSSRARSCSRFSIR